MDGKTGMEGGRRMENHIWQQPVMPAFFVSGDVFSAVALLSGDRAV